MRAIIQVDVPDHQIGQEVSIYFKDTMMIQGIVQESSGDAISREAVLDRKYVVEVKNMWHMTEEIEVVNVDDIKALPSVNPQKSCDTCEHSDETDGSHCYECVKGMKDNYDSQEPKTGHWISFGVQGEVDGQIVQTFTCSECDAISIFRMANGNIVNGDLCPNCGCRMVEPQERSEG